MFNISREDFFGIEKVKLLNVKTGEYVSILPASGCNLNELVLLNGNTLHAIIAGDESIESLNGTPINFYRGAKLSPFPNRIAVGKYTFQDKIYVLERNAGVHALHGLIWNRPFNVVHEEHTADFAEVAFEYFYNSEFEGYPFHYVITLLYRLVTSGLTCYTTILNTGKVTIPVGDGWHPYLRLGNKVDKLKLTLPACKELEMDACIPTGKYLTTNFSEHEIEINDLKLDQCFELLSTLEIATTELIDSERDIKIVVWQALGDKEHQGYTYLQIYIPPDRMSIAIEPMSCAPDAFNNKNGLIELQPNEHVHFKFGMQLKSLS